MNDNAHHPDKARRDQRGASPPNSDAPVDSGHIDESPTARTARKRAMRRDPSAANQRDEELAAWIYEGRSSVEIAKLTGLSDRQIRYIMAGEKRPGVMAIVGQLRAAFQEQNGRLLLRAKELALRALVRTLVATKAVSNRRGQCTVMPDNNARLKAASRILNEPYTPMDGSLAEGA